MHAAGGLPDLCAACLLCPQQIGTISTLWRGSMHPSQFCQALRSSCRYNAFHGRWVRADGSERSSCTLEVMFCIGRGWGMSLIAESLPLQATEKAAASQTASDARVITPLMEFVRLKHAKKSVKRSQQQKSSTQKVATASFVSHPWQCRPLHHHGFAPQLLAPLAICALLQEKAQPQREDRNVRARSCCLCILRSA